MGGDHKCSDSKRASSPISSDTHLENTEAVCENGGRNDPDCPELFRGRLNKADPLHTDHFQNPLRATTEKPLLSVVTKEFLRSPLSSGGLFPSSSLELDLVFHSKQFSRTRFLINQSCFQCCWQ